MEQKDFKFEIKSVDETGVFEGLLAVYNNVDQVGDIIEPGALGKTIAESGGVVTLLWQHDTKQPIGTLRLTDSPTALLCRGQLVLSVKQAQDAYALMKAGALKGLSIGYRVVRQAMSDNGIRRLKELVLLEGSLVTFAANPLAQVTAVKERVYADAQLLAALRGAAQDIKDFHRQMTR